MHKTLLGMNRYDIPNWVEYMHTNLDLYFLFSNSTFLDKHTDMLLSTGSLKWLDTTPDIFSVTNHHILI